MAGRFRRRPGTIGLAMGKRPQRLGLAVGILLLAGVLAGSAMVGIGLTDHPHAGASPSRVLLTTSMPATSDHLDDGIPEVPPGSTLVATTHAAIPGYAAPGPTTAAPPTPDTTVPGTWYGYPSILPVVSTQPGWLEVRLAQRPDGSTTWVRRSDVTLGNTPYHLLLDLSTMHLTVFEDGVPVLDLPAGIGAPDDPTPPGNYFVTMTAPPPSSGYGSLVLVTSDHSNSFSDWEDSGDAIIGIHGPITSYDDAMIGTTGAAISHGCIRLHDADLAQLSMIPPGTPLDIVS
jgi:lipoprotein-anchoring transpeptidase ErfK/SrfK